MEAALAYLLDDPTAKFATAQRGLRRYISLRSRLRILHAKRSVKEPRVWVGRTLTFLRSGEINRYSNSDFKQQGFLSVTEQIKSDVERFVARWKPRCDEKLQKLGGECPRSPFDPKELVEDETIRSLIFNRFVVGSVSAYLGEIPVFSNVDLWIGQQNDLRAGSPFWHLDSGGWGNTRLYVYLSDVRKGCGEFTYIPRTYSEDFTRKTRYLGDALSDAQVSSFFGVDHSRSTTGSTGTSFLIDTTRCLHYGSRCTAGNRYALILSYQRWSTPNSKVGEQSRYLNKKGLVPAHAISRLLVDAGPSGLGH